MAGSAGGSPNLETVRRVYDAYRHLRLFDLATVVAVSPPVVVRIMGDSPLAGTYRGLGAVLGFVGRAARRFVPSSIRLLEAVEDGDVVHSLVEVAVRNLQGETRTFQIRQAFTFNDRGRVQATVVEAVDQEAFDRFVHPGAP